MIPINLTLSICNI